MSEIKLNKIFCISSNMYSLRPRDKYCKKLKNEDFVTEYRILKSKEKNCKIDEVTNSDKSTSINKSIPLSKYRRKTANARERSRMREINLAFETLRKAVPSYLPRSIFSSDGSNEKFTKITTLRLAMKYISDLTKLLQENQTHNTDENSTYSNYCAFLQSRQDTLNALNDSSSCDFFESTNTFFNDGGSDGESFHSGATEPFDNFIGNPIENLVAELNLNFTENFINTEIS